MGRRGRPSMVPFHARATSIGLASATQRRNSSREPSIIPWSKPTAARSGNGFRRRPRSWATLCSGSSACIPSSSSARFRSSTTWFEDHPFLIVVNLFAPPEDAFSIFDADLDGHRLTMAASGYFHDGKPLLYDRGTESLWIEEGDSLKAIAGKHKGVRLRPGRPSHSGHLGIVAHPKPGMPALGRRIVPTVFRGSDGQSAGHLCRSARSSRGAESIAHSALARTIGVVRSPEPRLSHHAVPASLRVSGGTGFVPRSRSSFASASRSPGHSASTSRQSCSASA